MLDGERPCILNVRSPLNLRLTNSTSAEDLHRKHQGDVWRIQQAQRAFFPCSLRRIGSKES